MKLSGNRFSIHDNSLLDADYTVFRATFLPSPAEAPPGLGGVKRDADAPGG